MANSYSKLYIHLIFAVKERASSIQKPWREEVFKYISGTIKARGHQVVIINGMSDHVHILLIIKPTSSLSDLVRDIKANSSRYINESSFLIGKFAWQDGYGAFSCSESQVPVVRTYIQNQEKHHKLVSFISEFKKILEKAQIQYDDKYIFTME